jgi:hypothetical protein
MEPYFDAFYKTSKPAVATAWFPYARLMMPLCNACCVPSGDGRTSGQETGMTTTSLQPLHAQA